MSTPPMSDFNMDSNRSSIDRRQLLIPDRPQRKLYLRQVIVLLLGIVAIGVVIWIGFGIMPRSLKVLKPCDTNMCKDIKDKLIVTVDPTKKCKDPYEWACGNWTLADKEPVTTKIFIATKDKIDTYRKEVANMETLFADCPTLVQQWKEETDEKKKNAQKWKALWKCFYDSCLDLQSNKTDGTVSADINYYLSHDLNFLLNVNYNEEIKAIESDAEKRHEYLGERIARLNLVGVPAILDTKVGPAIYEQGRQFGLYIDQGKISKGFQYYKEKNLDKFAQYVEKLFKLFNTDVLLLPETFTEDDIKPRVIVNPNLFKPFEQRARSVMHLEYKIRDYLETEQERQYFGESTVKLDWQTVKENMPKFWESYADVFKKMSEDDVSEVFNSGIIYVINKPFIFDVLTTILGKEDWLVVNDYLLYLYIHHFLDYFPQNFRAVNIELYYKGVKTEQQYKDSCFGLNYYEAVLFHLFVKNEETQVKWDEQINQRHEIHETVRAAFIEEIKELEWFTTTTRTVMEEKIRNMQFVDGSETYLKDNPDDEFKLMYGEVIPMVKCSAIKGISTLNTKKKLRELVNMKDNNYKMSSALSLTKMVYSYQSNTVYVPPLYAGEPYLFVDDHAPAELLKLLNLASYGLFISRIMTNAFHSQGHFYDEYGESRDWLDSTSSGQFLYHEACLLRQTSNYAVHKSACGCNVEDKVFKDVKFPIHQDGMRTMFYNLNNQAAQSVMRRALKKSKIDPNQRDLINGFDANAYELFFLVSSRFVCFKQPAKQFLRDSVQSLVLYPSSTLNLATLNMQDHNKTIGCPVDENVKICKVF